MHFYDKCDRYDKCDNFYDKCDKGRNHITVFKHSIKYLRVLPLFSCRNCKKRNICFHHPHYMQISTFYVVIGYKNLQMVDNQTLLKKSDFRFVLLFTLTWRLDVMLISICKLKLYICKYYFFISNTSVNSMRKVKNDIC